MTYVKRANVVLEVEDDEIDHYLSLGYSVLDEKGNVVLRAIPTDMGELRKFYVDATAKIEQLEKRIAELESRHVDVAVEDTKTENAPKKRGRPAKHE